MSTESIIIIAVVAILVLLALVLIVPAMFARSRARREQRRLEQRREEYATEHRQEAEAGSRRADVAEHRARIAQQKAQIERAQAEMHNEQAELHEQGLADDRRRGRSGLSPRAFIFSVATWGSLSPAGRSGSRWWRLRVRRAAGPTVVRAESAAPATRPRTAVAAWGRRHAGRRLPAPQLAEPGLDLAVFSARGLRRPLRRGRRTSGRRVRLSREASRRCLFRLGPPRSPAFSRCRRPMVRPEPAAGSPVGAEAQPVGSAAAHHRRWDAWGRAVDGVST